jgi:spermidine dehydrogenase
MNPDDRNLGMDRKIARRDFLNGVAIAAAGALLGDAAQLEAQTPGPGQAADYYPPLRTGMRGSHPGSFEVAHEVRDQKAWTQSAADTGETYDLVIVGAGMSGLAAAHYFINNMGRNVRVLVLDNHDDFGGHAKRNEFHYNGRMLAINGGTLNIESPNFYNLPARQLLQDVGIDLERYRAANVKNRQLYSSFGLGGSYFFDKETWGSDSLIRTAGRGGITPEFIAKTPLTAKAKQDLARIYDPKQPDYMPGLSSAEKKLKLAKISYIDFLVNYAKVDQQVLWFVQARTHGLFCMGADAVPAFYCWNMNYPGFAGMDLEPTPEGVLAELPGGSHGRQKPSPNGGGEVHFPDGNATIARLLVRKLIPAAVPGTTMEDVATARVNYAQLDGAGQPVRIRLNSTVVNVRHDGDPAIAKTVVITYVKGGKTYRVSGGACVMACWNMFIPYLMPELPAKQKEALAYGVKAPLVYTSVAVRNWKAFQKLRISNVTAPAMYHSSLSLTEAVSLGDLKHAETPDDPVALHLVRAPCAPGKTKNEQFRAGRADLLATSFEVFERKIRDQLARTLSGGGFDPAADIIAITVNRWPHGYAFAYNSLYDPIEWALTATNTRPCVTARQPFGLVTIANSDAAASSHTDAAFLEAHRAVSEVLERRGMPAFKSSLGAGRPGDQPEATALSEIVNRIPDGLRFATLTDAPNNERIRYETAGPKPKSPPGVMASPIENISKNFGNASPGILRPQLSMIRLRASGAPSRVSCTVSPSSENFTAVSSRAWTALTSRPSFPRMRSGPNGGGASVTRRDSAKSAVLSIARFITTSRETGADMNCSPLTSI